MLRAPRSALNFESKRGQIGEAAPAIGATISFMNTKSTFDFGRETEPLKLWQWALFGALLVFALVWRILLHGGCQGSDDLTTWSMATSLSQGKAIPNVVTNYVTSGRYGPAFAVAVFLKLFGNHEWATLIYPIITSLVGIAVLFAAVRFLGADFWVSLIAAGSLAVNAIDISCATILFPDGPGAVFAILGIFGVLLRIANLGRQLPPPAVGRVDPFGLACGLSVYWAFMHKESVLTFMLLLVILPSVIWVFSEREMRKNIVRIVGSAIMGIVILALAEHLFHLIVFDDFLHRWKVVLKGHDSWFDAYKKSGASLNKIGMLANAWTQFWTRFPSTVVTIIAALGISIFQATNGRGRDFRSLLGIAFVLLALSSINETASVYEFEPRRYTHIVTFSLLVIAGAFGHFQFRWVGIFCSGLLLALAAWFGWSKEYAFNRGQQVKLSYDRKINEWLHESERSPANPVYLDGFTFMSVQALSGFQDLTGLGVTLLRKGSARYGALVANKLHNNSWVVYSPRGNEIVKRSYPFEGRISNYLIMPAPNWKVARVLPNDNAQGQCAIVFKVVDSECTTNPADHTRASPTKSWHLIKAAGKAMVPPAIQETSEVIVKSSETQKLTFESTASELTAGGAKTSNKVVFYSLRVDRPDIGHDGLKKVLAGFELHVRSPSGQWHSLGMQKRLLCYDSDPVFSAFQNDFSPDAVRLEVTIDQPGRYQLTTPRIELLPQSVTQSVSMPDPESIKRRDRSPKVAEPILSQPQSGKKPTPGEQFKTVTPDGAWCWFSEPRAVQKDGKVVAGWVTADGSIQVGKFGADGQPERTVTIYEKLERDDHDNPAFLFLPDGRLAAFFTMHGKDDMLLRITEKPGDIEGWSALRKLGMSDKKKGPVGITYANPVILSGENNRILLFFRGSDINPNVSVSEDLCATWSRPKTLFRRKESPSPNPPYVRYWDDGKGRVDILFTDGHPRFDEKNRVHFMRYEKEAFWKADGTKIGTMESLPLDLESADLLYDGSAGRGWIWDISEDKDGKPVVAYTRFPGDTKEGLGRDHRYHYCHWDGKQWEDHEVAQAGRWLPQTKPEEQEREPFYSPGIAIDKADASVLYYSAVVKERLELIRAATSDGGISWTRTPLTQNSLNDNVRPVTVRNAQNGTIALMWMNLRLYQHYTNYDASIRMWQDAR